MYMNILCGFIFKTSSMVICQFGGVPYADDTFPRRAGIYMHALNSPTMKTAERHALMIHLENAWPSTCVSTHTTCLSGVHKYDCGFALTQRISQLCSPQKQIWTRLSFLLICPIHYRRFSYMYICLLSTNVHVYPRIRAPITDLQFVIAALAK